MSLRIFQVDAFSAKVFAGNPAAVCVLAEPGDVGWMQNVATEMNLSETAFLVRQEDGFGLRWFTPTAEVDLCGHATLASAHILWEEGYLPLDQPARFHTHSGLLTAERDGDWIVMDFPAEPAAAAAAPPNLVEALGVTPHYIGKNRFDYLVVVDSAEIVRALQPDLTVLKSVDCRGVIVTSQASDSDYDFVSRFFAPNVGVNEDPVTGSAHCCLAPYWQQRLKKDNLLAYQASARGGELRLRVIGDRVSLVGQAVTVIRGELVP